MAACEECWAEAYLAAQARGGSTVDHYQRLLAEHPDHEGEPAAGPDPQALT